MLLLYEAAEVTVTSREGPPVKGTSAISTPSEAEVPGVC